MEKPWMLLASELQQPSRKLFFFTPVLVSFMFSFSFLLNLHLSFKYKLSIASLSALKACGESSAGLLLSSEPEQLTASSARLQQQGGKMEELIYTVSLNWFVSAFLQGGFPIDRHTEWDGRAKRWNGEMFRQLPFFSCICCCLSFDALHRRGCQSARSNTFPDKSRKKKNPWMQTSKANRWA